MTVNDNDIEIGRNGRLAAVLGVVGLALAVAFLVRGDGPLDLVLGPVLLVLAGYQLWTAWDSRAPLLVADDQGVRLRLGRVWHGIPWRDLDEVEHLPRRSWWRDGRLVLLPEDEAAQLRALPAAGRRHATLTGRLYGAPFALPLGAATVVSGGSRDLSSRLADLADGATTIVEIDPAAGDDAAEEPTVADGAEGRDPLTDTAERPVVASPAPLPLREPVTAVRAEVTHDYTTLGANALKLDPAETDADEAGEAGDRSGNRPGGLPEGLVLHRRPFEDDDDDRVTPIARPGEPVEPLAVEELGPTPAPDPVIGPELAAARTRIGLTVDQLAERTRIRPHVIEAIEVDDFGPCGGDFYARGHLRTLARVLGLDAAPLLQQYDATYADAPIDPRRVFEAELATGAGGPIRRMRGGPNWSVLVAAVMAVVLAWSIARLVLDGSATTPPPAPSLGSGSAGTSNPYGKAAKAVPVVITAAGGGTEVVVRDAGGDVVFSGTLAFGESKTLRASPPVRIQASDGSATVSVDGGKASAIGETGQSAQRTYTAD